MSLLSWLLLLLSPLGVTIPQLFAVFTTLGCIVAMAKDVRLGIMLLFIFSAIELSLLFIVGQDLTLHVIMVLASFSLLAVSYLVTYKKTQSPFEAI
jgi:hypothetical protein